jgi:tRNA(Ile)-lysidine synthase TilS/MesJ
MNKNLKTIEQKVIRFILDKNLIEKNDNVLVALSGGPDSVFLFEFLIKYKRRFNIKLAAFHLNHNLRGKESKDDAEFCKKITARNKISLGRCDTKNCLKLVPQTDLQNLQLHIMLMIIQKQYCLTLLKEQV